MKMSRGTKWALGSAAFSMAMVHLGMTLTGQKPEARHYLTAGAIGAGGGWVGGTFFDHWWSSWLGQLLVTLPATAIASKVGLMPDYTQALASNGALVPPSTTAPVKA